MSRPLRLIAVTALALLTFAPTDGNAATRGGSVNDPQESLPALSGGRAPDIKSVSVAYDDGGQVAVAVTLYEPWPQTSKTYPNYGIRIGSSQSGAPSYSCSTTNPGDVQVSGSLNPATTGTGAADFSIVGFSGTLPATRTFSADGLTTTFTANASQLAGRNYICTDDSYLSRPDLPVGHCGNRDCSYISYVYLDDKADAFFFDGFGPSRPQCSDGVDNDGDGKTDLADPDCASNSAGLTESSPPPKARAVCDDDLDNDGDGKTDTKDPGCRGDFEGTTEADPAKRASRSKITSLRATKRCALDIEVEVLPDMEPEDLFPFKRVKVKVTGVGGAATGYRKTRYLELGTYEGYRFSKLRSGRYKVVLSYPGDHWRFSSTAKTRTVRVC